MFRFYIQQGPHEWQICAPTLGMAIFKWRQRAIYPEGDIHIPVCGRPDSMPKHERIL